MAIDGEFMQGLQLNAEAARKDLRKIYSELIKIYKTAKSGGSVSYADIGDVINTVQYTLEEVALISDNIEYALDSLDED